ncbi:MAG: lipid-binding SYLF domain-containing protein [Pseudomonadota bacterium]
MTARRLVIALTLFLASSATTLAGPREEATLLKTAQVIEDTQAMPDQSMPDWLLRRAYAIAVVPAVVKVGLVGIGGRLGKGVLLVRDDQGRWSNPSFITVGGGSFGPQFGIESSDLILVFTTRRSIEGVTGGKLTLGAGASVAVGPVGRGVSGATDISGAEIYSYSRSQGFFGGIAIDGTIIAIDGKGNAAYYQKPGILASEVLASSTPAAAGNAQKLLAALRRLPSMSADAAPAVNTPTAAPAAAHAPAAPADGRGLESKDVSTYPLNEAPKR